MGDRADRPTENRPLACLKNLIENGRMKIGYARVSTDEQTNAAQLAALEAAGCAPIYQEKASSRRHLPEREQALAAARDGATLVVWRLDRLGRTMSDLLAVLDQITAQGGHFESLTEKIDTTGAAGRAMLHIIAAFAQFERDTISERTRAGLAAARKAGRIGGRPRALTRQQIDQAAQLVEGGASIRSVARTLKVAPSTLSQAIDRRTRSD